MTPTPALILAAGRGERMRPLTDTTPKPLLRVRGQPLLMWHVQALLHGGFDQLVINTAWLGRQIHEFFKPYRKPDIGFQLSLNGGSVMDFHADFSDEQADFGGALETAGGIARALPRLFPAHGVTGAAGRESTEGTESGSGTAGQPPEPAKAGERVFWLVAGDVYLPGFVFSAASVASFRASTALAHLWLVPNPPHNPRGDFGLSESGRALHLPATDTITPRYTYSTVGLYRAELFSDPWCDIPGGNPTGVKAPLAPLLRRAMDAGLVTAELYTGPWTDVGTPERLAALNA